MTMMPLKGFILCMDTPSDKDFKNFWKCILWCKVLEIKILYVFPPVLHVYECWRFSQDFIIVYSGGIQSRTLESRNEMMAIWCRAPVCHMQPQRCFAFHSLAGLLNLEPCSLLGEYSATGHAISCRSLRLYNCHHWPLLSTQSHLGRVGVLG